MSGNLTPDALMSKAVRSAALAQSAYALLLRVFDAAANCASSTAGFGFHPVFRCSATTLVKIPPRT